MFISIILLPSDSIKKSSVLFHLFLFQTSQWIIAHNKDELKLWSDNKTRCHHANANNSTHIKVWVKKNGNKCKYTKSWSLENESSALAKALLHKDVYLWNTHTLFAKTHSKRQTLKDFCSCIQMKFNHFHFYLHKHAHFYWICWSLSTEISYIAQLMIHWNFMYTCSCPLSELKCNFAI